MAAVPVVAAGVFSDARSAAAASITGPGTIDFNGSVKVTRNGMFDFDFFPTAGGTGEIDISPFTGTGGLVGFAPGPGSIKDLSLPFMGVLDEFLVLDPGAMDGEDSFKLEQVTFPATFADTTFGSSVTINVAGTFLSDTGLELPGTGVFTAQFIGQSVAQVQNTLNTGGELNTTFSASFEAENASVPEPSTMAGLALVAGFGTFLTRKKKAKN